MRMSATPAVPTAPDTLNRAAERAPAFGIFAREPQMEPDRGMVILARSLARALAWATITQAAFAQPSPIIRGRLLFLRCASCHDVTPGPSPKIGPSLAGVIGRRAGSLPGYAYSPAMKAQTFSWDDATLDAWLTKPSAVVPGTAMAFGGVDNAADRRAIIDYLRAPKP